MFSFLSKKKHSPTTDQDNIIPGPDSPPNNNNNADEFVLINSENPSDVTPQIDSNPVTVQKIIYVHYLHGVPFNISEQFDLGNIFDRQQSEIDGILACLTKQIQIDDYNFTLEREVISQ